jgi:ubiquinone/menaquinone biosynthesis C-methylase UbiE
MPDLTGQRYDRLAPFYDALEAPVELLRLAGWRKRLFERAAAHSVLEAGVGTGKNLPYYQPDLEVAGIDISPRMLDRARAKAARLNLQISLLEMDVQNLAFADKSFDTILATFVFCSVGDPVKGLRELRRVCKPGGRLLLLEHMRPESPWLGRLFDLLNPVIVRVMGANINRRTMQNIRKAGWHIRRRENLAGEVVRLIEAEPN